MDTQAKPQSNTEHFRSLSGSPGELTITTAIDVPTIGGGSGPASPVPFREGSESRRRLSWSRLERQHVDMLDDPLRGNTSSSLTLPPPPAAAAAAAPRVYDAGIADMDAPHGVENSPKTPLLALDANAHTAQATFIPPPREESDTPGASSGYSDVDLDDDRLRLTSFAASARPRMTSTESPSLSDVDLERTHGARMQRRFTNRLPPGAMSPFQRFRLSIRRASMRVVNLAGVSLEAKDEGIRLPDDEKDRGGFVDLGDNEVEPPNLISSLPLRGRTLAFFDSKSRIRLAMFRLLTHSWTEPVILVLIMFNAIVLTIQAVPVMPLPNPSSDNPNPSPAAVQGYFHAWEDFALFVVFIIFTLEAFARIIASGFILDPDVRISEFRKLVFDNVPSLYSYWKPPSPDDTTPNSFAGTSTVTLAMTGSLARSASVYSTAQPPQVNVILNQLGENIARPFALSHHRTGSAALAATHDAASTRAVSALLQTKAEDFSLPLEPISFSYPPPEHDPEPALLSLPVNENERASTSGLVSRSSTKRTFLARALRSAETEERASLGEGNEYLSLPFRLSVSTAQDHVLRNIPYLRHSWNRIDFIAVVSFWIAFALATAGLERSATRHIGMFRALSVLRTSRLLAVTNGTQAIMRSLKRATPLLVKVSYFVLFAMILFSIIGVQTFSGSYSRSCYLQPVLGQPEIQLTKSCGGHVNPSTLQKAGYIDRNGQESDVAKGYICPLGQLCKEETNPNSGVQSYDNVYSSALEVVIIASANGWSSLMYSMIDAEFFVSCLYFIVCILVLNFWLLNILVAVITNTFSAIRKETQKSAFGAAPLGPIGDEDEDGSNGPSHSTFNVIKHWYDKTKWVWVLFVLVSVVLQATRSVDSSAEHLQALNWGEFVLTILFDIDIIWRFAGYFPGWRTFFDHGNNWLDLILAIGCTIIQIPIIKHSSVYPWLTIFQLSRFYRVILEIPRMRPLLLTVFGNLYGLANMSLFVILANYIAALIAVQLLRGDLGSNINMNYMNIYNSFLAMYQIFSSENWVSVLFNTSSAEVPLGQAAITAVFLSLWLLCGYFILLQLFIAVINENFDMAEELKRSTQASVYFAMLQQHSNENTPEWLRKLNPYRWLKPSVTLPASPEPITPARAPSPDFSPPPDFAPPKTFITRGETFNSEFSVDTYKNTAYYSNRSINALHRLFAGTTESDEVPLITLKARRESTAGAPLDPEEEELERHIEILTTINVTNLNTEGTESPSANILERRMQRAQFIRSHPSYDKTFWIFSQDNAMRQFCQRLVKPARGDRIFGQPYSSIGHTIFQLMMLLCVLGAIVIEFIATPAYRRAYHDQHGPSRGSWFNIADSAIVLTLIIEFAIKIIADGFLLTPNAYIRSIWNVLDFFVLIGLMVNTMATLTSTGHVHRSVRALRALVALRFITLIDRMRTSFQTLLISGAVRIFDAALLAILYMIPYAVWGLNIFNGILNECNDTSVIGKSDCSNEYLFNIFNATGTSNSFDFPVPRVWSNPNPSTIFSFDDFKSSILILFEIVSLEGWVDAMNVATSAVGPDLQPQTNNAPANSIFFLIYNLLGGAVILTVFVSIIIGNFLNRAGYALLTRKQREWVDLWKLIKRQKPSVRPAFRPTSRVRAWCYERAIRKHGWWSRTMTMLFVIHVAVLMTQSFAESQKIVEFREGWFFAITSIYVIDVIVRFYGLGFTSFNANGWNLFDVVVSVGALVTTLVVRNGNPNLNLVQFQKLFLVTIAFKLVQRNDSLNQLFKTAVASLPDILSLLALWVAVFLLFAILFLEVFGLSRWGTWESRMQNYRTLGSALLMLAFMTTGEGWNQYMHDYAGIVYPRCTIRGSIDVDSDCGSTGWAFTLFIAWNLLSMYIFANMFTGVVVESFSYVFQLVGGAKMITRGDMRLFKKIWTEFANPQTDYLEKSRLAPFLSKLRGVFEVRIYPNQYTVRSLLNAAATEMNVEYPWNCRVGVDLAKLNHILNEMDHTKISNRRTLFSRLYNEALISQEPDRGISFTNMLMLLAHHKLIDDNEALNLKDLHTRTEISNFVNNLVRLDRVRSLMKMYYQRRKYRGIIAERRRRQMLEHGVPAIVVQEDIPTTPPMSTRDITHASRHSMGMMSEHSSPSRSPHHSPNVSLTVDTPGRGGDQQRNRSLSVSSIVSRQSSDLGAKFPIERLGEPDVEDPNHLVAPGERSLWEENMQFFETDERDESKQQKNPSSPSKGLS